MTDNTQPEALRLAEILEGDYCPDWFYEQGVDEVAAELRRLHAENERLAALVEAQQPATHVQNPAEIEHVAGDVSKNGPESNMTQQPSPTPQADSQPAPDEVVAMNRTRDLAEAGRWPSDWVEAYRRGYSDREKADGVTVLADGAEPVAIKVIGYGGSTGINDYLMHDGTVKAMRPSEVKWATQAAPTPPAQTADSALEDAARWFSERDNVLHSFWVLLGEAETQADNDNNPLLKHQVEGFYRQWNALNGSALEPRWVTRAARKQGGL